MSFERGKAKKVWVLLAIFSLVIVGLTIIIVVLSQNIRNPMSSPPLIEPPLQTSVHSNVDYNESQGFKSLTYVDTSGAHPLLTLPAGGKGVLPITIYANTNVTFNVSLSLDSTGANSNGVKFSISPENFTVTPGQPETPTLKVIVDKNAPSVLCLPKIAIQTNMEDTSPYIMGGAISMPGIMVVNSNLTPSCIAILGEAQITPPRLITQPGGSGRINSSAFTAPTPYYLDYYFPNLPAFNMTPGQSNQFIFGCLTSDSLSVNPTAQTGLSAQFSSAPTNFLFNNTEGKMYVLTITVNPNTTPGHYQVYCSSVLGSKPFKANILVDVT